MSYSYAELTTETSLSRESRRLDAGAAVFDPASRQILTSLGLRDGMSCLDIGAGTGTIAAWLAEVATVVALDRDVRMLDRARSQGVTVVKGDVTGAFGFAPASFDLIHARFVLMHLPQRREVLERLVSWLRPGGTLVISECWFPPLYGTMSRHISAALEAMQTLASSSYGMSADWATTLPEPLAAQGLSNIGMHVTAPVLTVDSPVAELLRASLPMLREPFAATGLLAGEQLDAALADLDDPSLAATPMLMLTGYGRK